jgi:hypothetical protein
MVTGVQRWAAVAIAVGVLLACDGGLGIGPARAVATAVRVAAGPKGATRLSAQVRSAAEGQVKTIHYLGYSFSVPKSWPVIDDSENPHGCVRFDEHAVYLGTVSAAEFCPSWLLGATESILIQPAGPGSAGPGPSSAGPGSARGEVISTEDPVSKQISVTAPRIQLTATFSSDPALIGRILASAGLPAPRVIEPSAELASLSQGGTAETATATTRNAVQDGSARPMAPAVPGMHYPMAAPLLPASVTSYFGLGFDSCAAPSRRYMRAWRHRSPYRAVGIYIGGADRACAQPNLSRSWVLGEAAAGWRFMPLYAGPQAEYGQLSDPYQQGRQAATDAVVQAARLGFGVRTPVYYDMEAYRPSSRHNVLRFLSAWTRTLHQLGYYSGVYSSSDSGVADLAGAYRNRAYTMPDIIFDALWNGSASVTRGNLHALKWAQDRRIHQFSGNVTQTFGGDTMNVDEDFLDVRVDAPRVTTQSSQAVTLPNGSVMAFYRGGKGQLRLDRSRPSGGWAAPVTPGGQAESVPSAIWTGSAVDVFYQGSDGYLWMSTFGGDGAPVGRRRLTMMGVLGSAPRAVEQPGGVIDVFWRGSADDHLWQGQYTPGSGWNGPQGLGGSLASGPAPVASSADFTSVFWKGTNSGLWVTSRGIGGKWSAPRDLGMAPVGGAPLATAQADGAIEVYWRGSGNPFLWECIYSPRRGWQGPRDLGGDLSSAVWPVTALGTVSVLWRGADHGLDYVTRRSGANWNVLAWQPRADDRLGWIGSAPFTAAGGPDSALHVFWLGRHGTLWTATLTQSGRWSAPARLS